MFETIYRCPRAIARHEDGPLYTSRVRYLEYLAANGAAAHTLKAVASIIYRAAVSLPIGQGGPVERAVIEAAAHEWSRRPFLNMNLSKPEQAEKDFRQTTCAWLRYSGQLIDSRKQPAVHVDKIDAFCDYLKGECGLASATISTARHHLTRLSERLNVSDLMQVNLDHVERLLSRLGQEGWTRNGIRSFAHYIRRFFAYGERQGWTKPGLAACIHGPRIYRHEQLPLGPAWPDVERVLASAQTNRKTDIRDRAILLLLAVYGFRVGEVMQLRIEDLNLEARTLTLARTKQRCAQLCPVIPSLAEAIERYCREVRPESAYPNVFLGLKAPYRPLSHGAFYCIVANRLQRLGISAPRCGPHGLRHACATHLLAEGFTLTEVGGHLGHRTIESTGVYAKVDFATLRAVADLDLGELL